MDYKQRYSEALERAKERYSACSAPALLEYIFPELKESEDERIWKLIKKYAHYNISDVVLDADHITRE